MKRRTNKRHPKRTASEHDAALRVLKDSSPLTYGLATNEPDTLASGLEILSAGIGRPWRVVRQELEVALKESSVSVEEFALEFCVELEPVFIAGVPHWRSNDGTLRVPSGWGTELFVDAAGILRVWTASPRSSP